METLFTLRASLQLNPPQGDKPQRFQMSAYDGGLLKLPNIPLPVVVDLQGMTCASQVKALLHHDSARPVGHMDQVEIGTTISTEGVLSVPANAGEIVAAQRNGFEWEASIGATIVGGAKEVISAGRTVKVNGRDFTGPLIVARKTVLREVSFVGTGAGSDTSARIAAMAVPYLETPTMEPTADPATAPKTPVEKIEAKGTESLATELAEIRVLKASLSSEMDAMKKQRAELQAENDRMLRERLVSSVDRIAAQYGASDESLLKDLKAKAGDGKVSESDIELTIVRASYANGKVAHLQPIGGKTGAPANSHVIEAALCLTNGWTEDELAKRGHFDEKTINAALGQQFFGFGLRALAIEHLRAHGRHVVGGQLQDDDIQAAIHYGEQDQIQASSGSSSISMPGVLSNVARKEVLRAYDAFPKTIVTIAKRASAADYKPFYMYRVSTGALLEQVGADGELKNMDLKEDPFQARVYPFGRKIGVNAVMMRNDDLGVFQDLSRLFGLTAARTIEYTGFLRLLSDQAAFWTTGKGNRLASGGASALSLDSIGEAYKLFLEMKDFTQQYVGIPPKYLLTAPTNAVKAKQFYTDTHLNLAVAGNTDAVYERPSENPYTGMFLPLYSPYLANGAVTNANGTQWMMLPDPTITSPIVVAYLDGRSAPQVKTWEAIPGKMGMQWDCTLSFGFNLHDDFGSVYSPGQ